MEKTKTLPFMKNRGLLDELSAPPAQREGIIIEKGAVLNRDYLEDNEELLKKYIEFFTSYPDLFLDLIAPADSNFKLFFYQRILLRVIMRYKKIYITAPRAFSKSFISILALILQCIFMPGTKRFICAPGKGQSVKIAKEKIKEILTIYPFLRREIKGWQQKDIPGIYNADEVELNFTNGSILNVVGALNSTRGGRRHGQNFNFSLFPPLFIKVNTYKFHLYLEDNGGVYK